MSLTINPHILGMNLNCIITKHLPIYVNEKYILDKKIGLSQKLLHNHLFEWRALEEAYFIVYFLV